MGCKRLSDGGAKNGAPAAFIRMAVTYDGQGCLSWPFATTKTGYGTISVGTGRKDRYTKLAHRVVCEAAHGPPPFPDAQVAHGCNVRACCNPAHLRWDTAEGNWADRIANGTDTRGERHGRAKLTAEQVNAIRAEPARSGASFAAEFGVHKTTVYRILRGDGWK